MDEEILLQTLEDLGADDFKKFKWFLQKNVLRSFPHIPRCKVEDADRVDTVDLLVQNYSTNSLKVTTVVLEKMGHHDLVQKLSNITSEPTQETGADPSSVTENMEPGGPDPSSTWSGPDPSSVTENMEPGGPDSSETGPEVLPWRSDRVDHGGHVKADLDKCFCRLTLDPNTANRFLKLSHHHRTVTCVTDKQRYPDHIDRFDYRVQVLCSPALSSRCYWEVDWTGQVDVAVSYRGIRRKGASLDCGFGWNHQSWSLFCSDDGEYSVRHCKIKTPLLRTPSSGRLSIYLDCSAGSLSFYEVSSDGLVHLHTFNTDFTARLWAGFWLGSGSSVSLCDGVSPSLQK